MVGKTGDLRMLRKMMFNRENLITGYSPVGCHYKEKREATKLERKTYLVQGFGASNLRKEPLGGLPFSEANGRTRGWGEGEMRGRDWEKRGETTIKCEVKT